MNTLILDSNILIYQNSDKEDLSKGMRSILYSLTDIYKELVISSISHYEVLKGVSTNKLTEFFSSINKLSTINADATVCRRAAHIHRIYHEKNIPDKQCSTEDIIIAASATVLPADVLTANGNDYPRPFFKEVGHWSIHYLHGDRRITLHIMCLRPDIEVIKDIYDSIMD